MLTPRKEQGSTENKSQDTSLNSATELQTAREDEKPMIVAHKFEGIPSADCLVCDLSYLNRRAHPLHLLRGA